MGNIFEELDRILKAVNEAETPAEKDAAMETAKKIVKSIPVSPEMETADQGKFKAWEKIAKYFYTLSMGGMPGAGISRKDDVDLPDNDIIDPKMKGKISGKVEDKEFEKNTVVWDDDEETEKLKKEIEVNALGEDDDFDDFDYRDNQFGDDIDMDDVDTDDMEGGGGGGGDDSDKSEDEKLRDAIDDAMDKLDGGKSKSKSKSKSSSGGEDGEEGEEGNESGSSGGESGKKGKSKGRGGQPGGDDEGEGDDEGGDENGRGPGGDPVDNPYGSDGPGGDHNPGGEPGGDPSSDHGGEPGSAGGRTPEVPLTEKEKRLKEIRDAIENGSIDDVEKSIERAKEGDKEAKEIAGETIGTVSDDQLAGDMEKAGVSKKDIEEMAQKKKDNKMAELDDDAMDTLKKDVIDGLEEKCKKKGGSALAKTIVKNALKSKVNDDEWRHMLKLFLKAKAVNKGDMSKSMSGTKYGHKNHLWRDAVLPTKTVGHGQVQRIYCFIDFSGSVNRDLVFVFLGRVIDLCYELNYTDVVIYGFGEKIVLPKEINGRELKRYGKEVILSQTWDFIETQTPGPCTENFEDVAYEILKIKRKERDAVYLIFGDGLWEDPSVGPMCLKSICGEKMLDRMCVLTYYDESSYWFSTYKGDISVLRNLVGMKNVICTKVSRIVE